MTYNGYANYPTWCIALWIDNDAGDSFAVRDMAREVLAGEHEYPELEVGDGLKDWLRGDDGLEAMAGIEASSLTADLLGWALDSVDWRELGEHYVTDVREGY